MRNIKLTTIKYSDILVNISKRFWRTEKFSVNLGRILKKCKCKKNLGTLTKIGKILGNISEWIFKKYEEVFEVIRSKFRVTAKKICRNR